jgi:hypothetical protein
VLARETRGGAVMDERTANLSMTVDGDRHADPGAADEDAATGAALAHRRSERFGKIRIVDGIAIHGAKIEHLESECLQLWHEQLFELEAAMIGGNGDSLGHPGTGKDREGATIALATLPNVGVSCQLPTIHRVLGDSVAVPCRARREVVAQASH